MSQTKILFEARKAETPTVSVIIPYKNGSPTIQVALDSLAVQRTDFPFEVIFADGGSADDSVKIIRKHPLVNRAAVIVLEPPPERSGQMPATNEAVRHSRGEFILLMQADVRITDESALTKVVQCFADPKVVGTNFILLGAGKAFYDYNFWGQVFLARYQGMRAASHFDTKFNGVRRSVFERIGGYDEIRQAWAAGDFDLEMRLRKEGELADTDIEGLHLHGYGQSYSAAGCIKKYCRNAEAAGVTASLYLKHPDRAPLMDVALKVLICLICLVSLYPGTWPWLALFVLALGVYWERAAFRHVRHWGLVLLPVFSFLIMYVFTGFYLMGLITQKTRFRFNNRMG